MQTILTRSTAGRDEDLVTDNDRAGETSPRKADLPGHVFGVAKVRGRSGTIGDPVRIVAPELTPVGEQWRGEDCESGDEQGVLDGIHDESTPEL